MIRTVAHLQRPLAHLPRAGQPPTGLPSITGGPAVFTNEPGWQRGGTCASYFTSGLLRDTDFLCGSGPNAAHNSHTRVTKIRIYRCFERRLLRGKSGAKPRCVSRNLSGEK